MIPLGRHLIAVDQESMADLTPLHHIRLLLLLVSSCPVPCCVCSQMCATATC